MSVVTGRKLQDGIVGERLVILTDISIIESDFVP